MDDRFPDVLPGAYADEITPDAEVFRWICDRESDRALNISFKVPGCARTVAQSVRRTRVSLWVRYAPRRGKAGLSTRFGNSALSATGNIRDTETFVYGRSQVNSFKSGWFRPASRFVPPQPAQQSLQPTERGGATSHCD